MGCPSSEHGGGDHNGKGRSRHVLRGQGMLLPGRGHWASPSLGFWGLCDAMQPCSRPFSAQCVSWGHFHPR